MSNLEGWRKIGVVGVDSGLLLICDPCYIDSQWKTESEDPKANFGYNACAKQISEKKHGQLNYTLGHPGLAVVFSPGFGDGTYEVWGLFKDYDTTEENPDIRIVEVRIKLIP